MRAEQAAVRAGAAAMLEEASEVLESVLKASCLPLSVLLFVPAVLLLLGPPPAAEAAHEFTVYRMQQYELGGQPYGEELHGPAGLGAAGSGSFGGGGAVGREPRPRGGAQGRPGSLASRRARGALGGGSSRARGQAQAQGRPLEGPVWLSFTAQAQHEQERGWERQGGDLEVAKDPCLWAEGSVF